MVKDADLFQIYSSMEKICTDLNNIIVALDQAMNRERFIPIGGNALRWDMSQALNSPKQWLPYFSQRVYVKKKTKKRAIGINILFKDSEFENVIPFIVCGLLIGNESIPFKNDLFYTAGWDKEGTDITSIEGTPFSITKDDQIQIYSYFIRLTSVNNQTALDDYIVNPLKKIYDIDIEDENTLFQIGREISDKTISIEHIKGEQ